MLGQSNINERVMVCGLGQLGILFSSLALKQGFGVIPINRKDEFAEKLSLHHPGTPIFICVGEGELEFILKQIPGSKKNDCVFVQNELFTREIQKSGFENATHIQVWISTKKQTAIDVCGQSILTGPHAERIAQWMNANSYRAKEVSVGERASAIAEKYAFIVAFNILSAFYQMQVSDILEEHGRFVDAAVSTGIQVAFSIEGSSAHTLSYQNVLDGIVALGHLKAGGRSTKQRLINALSYISELEVSQEPPRLLKEALAQFS